MRLHDQAALPEKSYLMGRPAFPCYKRAVQSLSVGDQVQETALEREYAAYAQFCTKRSIKPPSLETWAQAQHRGWKAQRIRESMSARTQADHRTIREVLLP